MRGSRLPRSARLPGGREFQAVFDQGRRFVGRYVVLRHLPEGEGWRVAFVVGRKLGKAVYRNRVRRRLREAFRTQLPALDPVAGRFVFLARSGAETAPFEDLRADMRRLLDQAGGAEIESP